MSLTRAAPIRFLIGVTIVWTIGRGAVLMGWQPPAVPSTGAARRAVASRTVLFRPLLARTIPPSRSGTALLPFFLRAGSNRSALETQGGDALAAMQGLPFVDTRPVLLAAGRNGDPLYSQVAYSRPTGIANARSIARSATPSRLSGSAWAFVRGGGRATALSPNGQIGGGQTGMRLLYRLAPSGRLAASGRLSTTLGGIRQSEAAVGLDWAPAPTLPLHLMLDRRIAIDKGGRNAWTAGIAGGLYALPIAKGWRLDGYGEAGLVGLRRRDPYADGAVRIARAIDLGNGRSLALGGGAWGAAQPGAARLDLGPSAVLRLPVSGRAIAVALDWRERIAGRALPGSGVALTIASDF